MSCVRQVRAGTPESEAAVAKEIEVVKAQNQVLRQVRSDGDARAGASARAARAAAAAVVVGGGVGSGMHASVSL